MSSRQKLYLSALHLFMSTFFIALGSLIVALYFFPHVRFWLADELIEGKLWVFAFGYGLLFTGWLLLGALLWLYRRKFIQIKLCDGQMSVEQKLLETAIRDFWQNRFSTSVDVLIAKKNQIELVVESLDESKIGAIKEDLSKYLVSTLGSSPAILLTTYA